MLTGFPGGEKSYLTLAEDGRLTRCCGTPPVERLRGEIAFGELPDEARDAALKIYRELWGL